mmetsp:Transcript_23859/g.41816  ORF Transcript_23859/g.41816 Transcript_23859/m.41816 type:complete len:136 (+) Transcript_23859:264-671(+)
MKFAIAVALSVVFVAAPTAVLSGDIGDRSCGGVDSCEGAEGDIGDESCGGESSCAEAEANIDSGSCNGVRSCFGVTEDVAKGTCNNPFECCNGDAHLDDCCPGGNWDSGNGCCKCSTNLDANTCPPSTTPCPSPP